MIQIRQPKHSTTIVWFSSRFAHACGLPCRSNGSKAGPHTNASYAAGVRRIGVNECNRLISTTDSWFARSIANQTVVSLSDLALENGTEWLHVMCPQSLLRLSLVANLGLPCRLRHGDVYGRARSRLRVLVGSDHSDAMRAGSQTEF